jgi:hypothetical protein
MEGESRVSPLGVSRRRVYGDVQKQSQPTLSLASKIWPESLKLPLSGTRDTTLP